MYTTVIFDFDGTLADTGKGVFSGVRYALEKLKLAELDEETLKKFIGPPLDASFKEHCNLDAETAAEAVRLYREYYSAKGVFELEFYPGVIDTLNTLKKSGVRLAVGSSKPEHFLNIILKDFKLDNIFDYVAGESLGKPHSSKTEIINRAMENLGVTDKNTALMVGDRCFDIDGAHGAGIKCAGVLKGGYGDRAEFESAGADYIVDEVGDVLGIVEKSSM